MEKVVKKKVKLSKSALILIIGILIIAIPCVIFGGIILSSYMQSGSPVIGKRFDNDLTNEITKDKADTILSSIKSLSNVDDASYESFETGTFTLLVDINDSATSEEAAQIAASVYEIVDKTLPIATYFTQTDSIKNYDLSIQIYNREDANDDYDTWVYVFLTKNSKMETPEVTITPVNPELAKELRGELEAGEMMVDDTAGTNEESGD